MAVSGYLAAAEPGGHARARQLFDEAADIVPSLTAILPAGLVDRAVRIAAEIGWVRRGPAALLNTSRRRTADREPPPVREDEPYIAIIGDRVVGLDRHDSIEAAIAHATTGGGRPLAIRWAATNGIDHDEPAERLRSACALWVAPGTPYRSTEGALAAIKCAREQRSPPAGDRRRASTTSSWSTPATCSGSSTPTRRRTTRSRHGCSPAGRRRLHRRARGGTAGGIGRGAGLRLVDGAGARQRGHPDGAPDTSPRSRSRACR